MAGSRKKKGGSGRVDSDDEDVGSDPTRPIGNYNPPKRTQFGQPGGNPPNRKGAPRKKSLAAMLRRVLSEECEVSPGDYKTIGEQLIRAVVKEAVSNGSSKHASLIFNYHDGLPSKIAETDEDGNPIEIVSLRKRYAVDPKELAEGRVLKPKKKPKGKRND